MIPEDVLQLASRLRSAARPAGAIDDVLARVEPLAEVARRWLDPADPIRAEALDRLPDASPFPRRMWEAALAAMFAPITADALRRFVHDELADAHAFGVAAELRFPPLIGQVLAGNVPAAAVQSIFCGVLAGSGQLVKSASEDRLFPTLLAKSIDAVDASLGRRIAVVYWPGENGSGTGTRSPSSLRDSVWRLNEDAANDLRSGGLGADGVRSDGLRTEEAAASGSDCNAALAASTDAIVVFGRAETIDAWRRIVESISSSRDRGPILIAHGPRTSLELIDLLADESAWARLADDITFDIALYDQQGCLSPQQIYIAAGHKSACCFAALLGESLSRRATDWPVAGRSLADRLAVRRAREAHRIRRLVEPDRGPWLSSELVGPLDRFDWTLLSTAGQAMTVGPGMRTTFLTRVDSLHQAAEAIRPMAEAIQGVAVESPDFPAVAEMLREQVQIPYVCRPGQLQRPPFGWPNDGVRPLAAMLL